MGVVWVCACYNGEKESVPEAYSPWRFSTMTTSASWRKGYFLGNAPMKKAEVHEHHQANRLLCVSLVTLGELIWPWSEPTGSATKHIAMFNQLMSRIRALQVKLDGDSELEAASVDRVVRADVSSGTIRL